MSLETGVSRFSLRLSRARQTLYDCTEKVSLLRLHGRFVTSEDVKGTVYERGTPEFDKFFEPKSGAVDLYDFPTPEMTPGARAVIWIDITRVGSSCGYSVPFMQFVKESKSREGETRSGH